MTGWTARAAVALTLAASGLAATTAAQAAGDTVRAWGSDSYGALGTGSPPTDSSTPVTPSGISGVVAIAAGARHSLALLSNGTVKAWGSNRYGQLGDETTVGPDGCGPAPCSMSPIDVHDLSGAVAISAGDEHSLALMSNGTVKAWGWNQYGQLGDTTTTTRTKPVTVPGLSNVVAIAAGGFHNLALLSNGKVMAWGLNLNGQLGNGDATGPDTCNGNPCANAPIPVGGVSGVMAIAAGLVDSQSVALLSNGTLVDWGLNTSGELGIGNNTGPDTCGLSSACSKKPIAVSGLSGVVSIAAGAGHTLARRSNGTALTWGDNYHGQLGDGSVTDHYSPAPVGGLTGVAGVAGADGFSFALRSNGGIASWGYNVNGQLGNGNNTGPDTCNGDACSKKPIAVGGLSSGTAIAGGFSHSLALVGPARAVKISLAGRGKGAVGGTEILCPLVCSHRYAQGAPLNLLAHPAIARRFAGFSGACKGTSVCRLTLGSDRKVVATFGKPKGTKITKSRIRRAKGTVKFSLTAPGAITGFECALVKRKLGQTPSPHFSKCKSGKRYKNLSAGRYTFRVRALDILGADPVPARKKFKI